MSGDAALEFFLADAETQGLSLAEYERKYGVILEGFRFPNPAEQRIRRHEVSGGVMDEADFEFARHKERRRAQTRRQSREPATTVVVEDDAPPS